MKKTLLVMAGILILAGGVSAAGRRDKTEVDFNALKGMEDKKGRSLDGSVKFYFADEKAPFKGGEELSARGNTMAGGTDEERCERALLAAFLTFQERAKSEGKTAVVDIKTYSEKDVSSGNRKKCLCVSGGFRTGTVVKGRLAK